MIRLGLPLRVLLVLPLGVSMLLPATTRAELKIESGHVGGLLGYDSNVGRVGPRIPGLTIDPDGRGILSAGAALDYRHGDGLRLNLEANGFYTKYAQFDDYDRADVLLDFDGATRLAPFVSLELDNIYRFRTYPNVGLYDRTYNSTVIAARFGSSNGTSVAPFYRLLYRQHPRFILENVVANAAGVNARWRLSTRWGFAVRAERDWQSVRFVFPTDVTGTRDTGELSMMVGPALRSLVRVKYIHQRDQMDIVFTPGLDIDGLDDPADYGADGLLQSLRFLEDSDFNFAKHLAVLSTVTRVTNGLLAETVMLYQHKTLEQRVVELADRPRGRDETVVLQLGLRQRLATGLFGLVEIRYEQATSNDPDREFDLLTIGAGIRKGF